MPMLKIVIIPHLPPNQVKCNVNNVALNTRIPSSSLIWSSCLRLSRGFYGAIAGPLSVSSNFTMLGGTGLFRCIVLASSIYNFDWVDVEYIIWLHVISVRVHSSNSSPGSMLNIIFENCLKLLSHFQDIRVQFI